MAGSIMPKLQLLEFFFSANGNWLKRIHVLSVFMSIKAQPVIQLHLDTAWLHRQF